MSLLFYDSPVDLKILRDSQSKLRNCIKLLIEMCADIAITFLVLETQ